MGQAGTGGLCTGLTDYRGGTGGARLSDDLADGDKDTVFLLALEVLHTLHGAVVLA